MQKFKEVPQLDDDGYFTGSAPADECPMRPGVYIIGHNAVDTAFPPREAGQNEAIKWTGKVWLYVPDYSQAQVYDKQTGALMIAKRGLTLEAQNATLEQPLKQVKANKLNELADLRWQVQCAGVKVAGINHQNSEPVIFASSPDDLTRLTAAIEYAQDAYDQLGEETTVFKAQSGFIDVTVEQLNAARQKIMLHTNQCYMVERTHADIINVLTTAEDVAKYNLNSGWPV